MRHYKKGRKLGTDWSHTKAMKRSLVSALFLNDRIKTVEARAKEIRPDVDKIITWAKKGDLHSRRLAIAYLNDKYLVQEIFEKVSQGMFEGRNGGYTRIMKLGNRKGDNASMVIMELVTENVVPKDKKASKATPKPAKATPKKVADAQDAEAAEAQTSDEVVEPAYAEVEHETDAEVMQETIEAAVEEAAEDIDAVDNLSVETAAGQGDENQAADTAKAEEAARESAMKAEEAVAKNAEAQAAETNERGYHRG